MDRVWDIKTFHFLRNKGFAYILDKKKLRKLAKLRQDLFLRCILNQ